jgi:hypothetical protein
MTGRALEGCQKKGFYDQRTKTTVYIKDYTGEFHGNGSDPV